MEKLIEEFRNLMEELSKREPDLYKRLLGLLERIRKQYAEDCQRMFPPWMFPPWMIPSQQRRKPEKPQKPQPRRGR